MCRECLCRSTKTRNSALWICLPHFRSTYVAPPSRHTALSHLLRLCGVRRKLAKPYYLSLLTLRGIIDDPIASRHVCQFSSKSDASVYARWNRDCLAREDRSMTMAAEPSSYSIFYSILLDYIGLYYILVYSGLVRSGLV